MSNLSVGAQRLRAAGSIAATAKLLRVATRTISSWRSGRSVPSARFRARIARKLQIEPAAWDVAAPESSAVVYAAAVQETLAALRAHQAEIAEALKDDKLTPRARFEYAALALRTARTILKLQQPAKPRRRSANHAATLALSASRYFRRVADEIASLPSAPSSAPTLDATRTHERSE